MRERNYSLHERLHDDGSFGMVSYRKLSRNGLLTRGFWGVGSAPEKGSYSLYCLQDARNFSHGCIRVKKPADLVVWALRNNPAGICRACRPQ